MQVLEGHTGIVLSLCYSPHDSSLMSGGKDGALIHWQGFQPTHQFFLTQVGVQSIACNELDLWLVGTQQTWFHYRTEGWVNSGMGHPSDQRRDIGATSVAFLNDDILVVGYGNRIKPEPGAIEIWPTNLKVRKEPHFHAPYGVRSVTTHPSGCIAWTEWGSRSETGPRLYLWETGQQDRVRYNLPIDSGSVVFHPEGRLLALTSSWQVAIYDRKHHTIMTHLQGHKGAITSLAFHPDGRTLASGSWDKTIRIWDVETWKEVTSFRSMVGKIYSLAYAPDGLQLAAGGDNGCIMMIDTE